MGNKAGKIALGLGLLTGAVTGFLFAPEEGKKIRQKLAKGDTKGLLKDLEAVGGEIRDMVVDLGKMPPVKEALEKAKDKAADVANIKREELDTLLKTASKKVDQFKQKLSDYVKEQKSVLEEHLDMKGKPTKSSKKKAAPKKKLIAKQPVVKKPSTKKRKK
jgi:gas vesicle protein